MPATLFALAMTSALTVGGMYVARRHVASSLETSAALSLRPRAERAAVDAVVQWDSTARANQPVSQTEALAANAATATWLTRTSELEYMIVAEARTSTRPALYHRVGLSVIVTEGKPRLAFPRAWSLLP